mmetsp:Transcript_18916/g.56713  ORF Transcript_18916/g.56713 Transcript_18916/m.56713 type:complete len:253 (-) Transcript_18916:650-1408(-)
MVANKRWANRACATGRRNCIRSVKNAGRAAEPRCTLGARASNRGMRPRSRKGGGNKKRASAQSDTLGWSWCSGGARARAECRPLSCFGVPGEICCSGGASSLESREHSCLHSTTGSRGVLIGDSVDEACVESDGRCWAALPVRVLTETGGTGDSASIRDERELGESSSCTSCDVGRLAAASAMLRSMTGFSSSRRLVVGCHATGGSAFERTILAISSRLYELHASRPLETKKSSSPSEKMSADGRGARSSAQ